MTGSRRSLFRGHSLGSHLSALLPPCPASESFGGFGFVRRLIGRFPDDGAGEAVEIGWLLGPLGRGQSVASGSVTWSGARPSRGLQHPEPDRHFVCWSDEASADQVLLSVISN